MHAHRARLVTALVLTALGTALVPLTVGVPTASAEPTQTPTFSEVPATVPSAEEALATATATFAGEVAHPDATLALRDLDARLPEYSGRDKAVAQQLLARPNGGTQGNENATGGGWPGAEAGNSPLCDTKPDVNLCVHWTNTSRHEPPTADKDSDGVPDRVEVTLDEMTKVWRTEIGSYGYRKPLSDQRGSIDAGGAFDVYLSDIGNNGLYGYCAVDDTRTFQNYKFWDRSGYCVLDNDFARSQFPTNSPIENLQVTAAHEFFHAIQFGYDAYEDGWFMEGTAAWIEDEVYDRVNDNRQYLRSSQFVRPARPLDASSGLTTVYGSWGYFRYLSEDFGRSVVRTAWNRADGSRGAPDDYSMSAVKRAISTAGGDFTKAFGDFARAILAPAKYFDEGRAYPSPRVNSDRLGGRGASTGWLRSSIDHLAIDYRAVSPSDRTSRSAKVHVRIDAPARATSPQARVLVQYRDGSVTSRVVSLNRNGAGDVTVDFGRNSVKKVTAALVNASDRYRACYRYNTEYACGGGIPTDDNRTFRVSFEVR